jgi:hypothetical protein
VIPKAILGVGVGKPRSRSLDSCRLESWCYSSVERAHPEIECVRADGPDPGRWTGVAGLLDAWRDFLSAWDGYSIEVEEYRELDGERILALTQTSGRGQTSELSVGQIGAAGATAWHV